MADQIDMATARDVLRAVVDRWHRRGHQGGILDAATAALAGLAPIDTTSGSHSDEDAAVLVALRDTLAGAVERARNLGHGDSLTAAGAQLVAAIDSFRSGQ
ncbi:MULTISPECIES: hypothetical protein [Mycolicibacter]|uniref:Uncharacterized protein n=2 Tax=Mycolicibacter TaxID=1073531 RepID=A0ABU5XMI6_9MYCO|nr:MULTISPECIES: hypothetical protein [unclassified Mycolicibacter]MEB3023419.1 hypothetical protein [Mycolicibacter sp. MYC098]MEB3033761.1 hypothetical protein [Mycolicibacter sp. MYC340]